MSRYLLTIVAAAIMAVTLQSQTVRAQDASWLFGHQDPRLTVTGIAVGAGATAGYFALRHKRAGTLPGTRVHLATPLGAYAMTTVGCAAAFPIIGTLWLNRPLTTREVYTGMADCVVPILGSLLIESAFHGQAWYEGEPEHVAYRRHHHHRHM